MESKTFILGLALGMVGALTAVGAALVIKKRKED